MNRVAAILSSTVVTLALAGMARAPYSPPGAGDALLRLSWRMSVSTRENCRPRTEAELADLPIHMRTPEACTRVTAAHALVMQIDDAAADTLGLLRGGVKGDRPLFVLEERSLAEGEHRVRVTLQRLTESGAAPLAQLDTVFEVRSGAVRLITMDDSGRLILRARAGPPQ